MNKFALGSSLPHFGLMLAEVDRVGLGGFIYLVLACCGVVIIITALFLPLFVAGIYSQIQLTNRLLKQLIKLYGHDPEK